MLEAPLADTYSTYFPAPYEKAPSIDANAAPDRMRKAAEEFESFFISQMFEMMFTDIETDGPFGGGPGEKIFRSLLVSEYAKSTTAQGGIGIADVIVRQLLANQEVPR